MEDYHLSPEDTDNIQSVWTSMSNDKGDLVDRSREYARLTVPSVCPMDGAEGSEVEKGNVLNGAQVVNSLANKLANVLFPHDRPYFKLELDPQVEYDLAQTVDQTEIDAAKTTILEQSLRLTKLAMDKLMPIAYRPMAIEASRHLIVTGNAIIRRMGGHERMVYGVQNIGVRRDVSTGKVYDVVLRDSSRLDSLPTEVQEQVIAAVVGVKPNTVINLFSRWRWRERQGKWEFTQAVDNVALKTWGMIAPNNFPLIILTWSRATGENYGRGLCEDSIGLLSAADVSTTALLDLMGIAADVKWLVNPASVLDVMEMVNSPRGSYHVGADKDISSPNASLNKANDLSFLAQQAETYERKLATAFLMTTGGIRDAERVTAEEIRFYAKEIESAFGGLYSAMSLAWQKDEAEWAVRQINTSIPKTLKVTITTGLDALSSEAAMMALTQALTDLSILNGLPEDARSVMSLERIAQFIFANRGLSVGQFMKTPQELEQERAAAQAAAQAQANMESQARASEHAAAAAAQEP